MNANEYNKMASRLDTLIKTKAAPKAVPEAPPAIDWHDDDIYAVDVGDVGGVSKPICRATRTVIFTNGMDLTPEPIIWLWPNWLAQGKFHIIAGTPGQGKTTIAMAMAATVTVGGRWPDGTSCAVGNVLIWSGEDDPADTLLPRLIASGADRSKCYFVSGTKEGDELQSFEPSRDMAALELQAIAIGGISLLIIDPVVSAVSGDSHKNAEVRRDLQPIVDLASRLGAAAVGITHLSKGGTGSDPATRVIGSVAFTAVARVVLVAAKVKSGEGDDESERRVLVRGKSNIGPDNGGFEYHIEQSEPLPGIHASYVTWGNPVEGSARELLMEPDEKGANGTSDANDATELLREELTAECWTNSALASKPLADAGFTKKQIWSATKRLGVIRHKTGFGKDFQVHWRLPGRTATDSKRTDSTSDSSDSPFEMRESLESVEKMESVEDAKAGNPAAQESTSPEEF